MIEAAGITLLVILVLWCGWVCWHPSKFNWDDDREY